MELINFGHSSDFIRIVAMMGKWMMWIRNADFGVCSVTCFPCQLESGDTRDVPLKGEQLKAKFKEDLELEYAAEPGIEGLSIKGIGLLLGYGGYNRDSEGPEDGASRSTAMINEIRALLPELFQSTASRPFGTRSVGAGLVGIEVYPLVEGPCS